MTQRHPRGLAYLALAAGVICIAWSGVIVRLAGVPGVSAAFYRFAVAALVLGPWCVARLRARGGIPRHAILLACIAGAFFACDNAIFNVAVQRTSVSIVTLLANTSPLFVALAVWIAFRERLSRTYWTGLFLAAIGSAIVLETAAVGTHGLTTAHADVSGDLLAILAAIFFAGYLVATQRARADADTLTLTTLAVTSGALLLLFACLIGGAPLGGFRPASWIALIALGLVSQVGGYLGVTYALGTLDATVTSVAILGQVPVTAVVAAVVLQESLSMTQTFGGLLVLAGIYVVLRPDRSSAGARVSGDDQVAAIDDAS